MLVTINIRSITWTFGKINMIKYYTGVMIQNLDTMVRKTSRAKKGKVQNNTILHKCIHMYINI